MFGGLCIDYYGFFNLCGWTEVFIYVDALKFFLIYMDGLRFFICVEELSFFIYMDGLRFFFYICG